MDTLLIVGFSLLLVGLIILDIRDKFRQAELIRPIPKEHLHAEIDLDEYRDGREPDGQI